MRRAGPPPTRHALLRDRRRLERVRRGQDVLHRRRRALVAELFRLARPAADLRARLQACADEAYDALIPALGTSGGHGTRASGWPPEPLSAELETIERWGVAAVRVSSVRTARRTPRQRAAPPGAAGPAVDAAAEAFETLVDLLLEAVSEEMALRRLADALAQASRQLNTLERRIAPELVERIARTTRTLEEREREDHQRLKRIARERGRHVAGHSTTMT